MLICSEQMKKLVGCIMMLANLPASGIAIQAPISHGAAGAKTGSAAAAPTAWPSLSVSASSKSRSIDISTVVKMPTSVAAGE